MTAIQRRRELECLRESWTAAIHGVWLAKPGTPEWTEGRLVERHTAAEYLRGLADPYQERSAVPA